MKISFGFRPRARVVFADKHRLEDLVLQELRSQFEWEWHTWPIFERYIPTKVPSGEEGRRPIIFERVTLPPPPRPIACVSTKFIAEQVERAKKIVKTARSLEELIERLTKEVEVL